MIRIFSAALVAVAFLAFAEPAPAATDTAIPTPAPRTMLPVAETSRWYLPHPR